MLIENVGYATGAKKYEVNFDVFSINKNEGSKGGVDLLINGSGFTKELTKIKV